MSEPVFAGRLELAPLRPLIVGHLLLLAIALTLWTCWPNSHLFHGACTTLMIAQWGLLSVWLILGPERTLRRIALVASLVLVALEISDPIPWTPMASVLLVWMWFWIAIYTEMLNLPLTFIKRRGLRVRRLISGDPPEATPLQFRISRLLAVTTLAAILFGVVQNGWKSENTSPPAFVLAMLTVFAVGITLFLSWTRVCVWIALYPGRVAPRMAVAAYFWLLAFLLVGAIPTTTSSGTIHFDTGGLDSAIGFAVTTAIFLTSLFLARRRGYYAIVWLAMPGPFGYAGRTSSECPTTKRGETT